MKLYVQHRAPMEAELIQKAEEEEEEGSVVAAKNTRIIAAQVGLWLARHGRKVSGKPALWHRGASGM